MVCMHFQYLIKIKKIFLSRDKIEKTLYYYFDDEYLIWSSELRSFNYSPIKNNLSLNEEAIRNYFDVGYIPAPLSIFKNVNKFTRRNYRNRFKYE